jgi:phage gp29-like protein
MRQNQYQYNKKNIFLLQYKDGLIKGKRLIHLSWGKHFKQMFFSMIMKGGTVNKLKYTYAFTKLKSI